MKEKVCVCVCVWERERERERGRERKGREEGREWEGKEINDGEEKYRGLGREQDVITKEETRQKIKQGLEINDKKIKS